MTVSRVLWRSFFQVFGGGGGGVQLAVTCRLFDLLLREYGLAPEPPPCRGGAVRVRSSIIVPPSEMF